MSSDRIAALIKMLGSPKDNEVLVAAKELVKELESTGEDLNAVAQAWEHRRVPRPKPFDFTTIETALANVIMLDRPRLQRTVARGHDEDAQRRTQNYLKQLYGVVARSCQVTEPASQNAKHDSDKVTGVGSVA